MKRAVFIDKDGTLIRDVPYNVNPEFVCLNERAGEALKLLQENHYIIIVISNQSGVAKGFFSENDLEGINVEIQNQLLPHHVQIDAFYYCPHLPEGVLKQYAIECNCRKPKPGLIISAANDFDIDVHKSWIIGDILNDIEAGNNAGCRTILLDNGNETEWILNKKRTPNFAVESLLQAAEIIIKAEKMKGEIHDKLLA